MGINIRYGGNTYDLSFLSPKNPPSNYGTARLNFRVNSTSVEKYGFTTDTSASRYCKFKARIGGKIAYLGTMSTGMDSGTTTPGGYGNYNTTAGNSTSVATVNGSTYISNWSRATASARYTTNTNSYKWDGTYNGTSWSNVGNNANGTYGDTDDYHITYSTSFKSSQWNDSAYTTNGGGNTAWMSSYRNTYSASSSTSTSGLTAMYHRSSATSYSYWSSSLKIDTHSCSTTATNTSFSNFNTVSKQSTMTSSTTYAGNKNFEYGKYVTYSSGYAYSSTSYCYATKYQYASSYKVSTYVYARMYHYGSFFIITNASGSWTQSAGFNNRTAAIAAKGATWGSNGKGIWYQTHTKSATYGTSATYGPMSISSGYDINNTLSGTYSNTTQFSVYVNTVTYNINNGDEIPFVNAWTATSTNNASLKYGASFVTSNSGAKRWGRSANANLYVNGSTTRYTLSSAPAGQTFTSFGSAKTWRRWLIWKNQHTFQSFTYVTSGGAVYNTNSAFNMTVSMTLTLSRQVTVSAGNIEVRQSHTYSSYSSYYSELRRRYSYSSTTGLHNYNI